MVASIFMWNSTIVWFNLSICQLGLYISNLYLCLLSSNTHPCQSGLSSSSGPQFPFVASSVSTSGSQWRVSDVQSGFLWFAVRGVSSFFCWGIPSQDRGSERAWACWHWLSSAHAEWKFSWGCWWKKYMGFTRMYVRNDGHIFQTVLKQNVTYETTITILRQCF